MKKTWRWEVVDRSTDLSDYLNKLDNSGVKPEEIKICERHTVVGYIVHYYADKCILPSDTAIIQ